MINESEGTSVVGVIDGIVSSATNYWIAFCCDVLVGVAFLAYGLGRSESWFFVLPTLTAGFLAATLLEYGLHRWMMHGPPSIGQREHVRHHDAPTALVSTPMLTVGVTAFSIFLGLRLMVSDGSAGLIAAGLYAGYLHFAVVHHLQHGRQRKPPTIAHYRHMRQLHLVHHHRMMVNFGITTTCWDRVFGTFQPAKVPVARVASRTACGGFPRIEAARDARH